jgi:beta-lactamase class A
MRLRARSVPALDTEPQRFNRRRMLAYSGSGVAAAGLGTTLTPPAGAASAAERKRLARKIINEFRALPGQKAMKIYVPGTRRSRPWTIELNPGTRLVVASSFKGFVLAESLLQAERKLPAKSALPLSQQLDAMLGGNLLPLDESIWVGGSSVFQPPNMSGTVSERTALEAMISHSDNTGTDIAIKNADIANVRALIARLGLKKTQIPDSVRRFYAYFLGIPDWQNAGWAELNSDTTYPYRQPFNPVQSSISCPDDFVRFYTRAMAGNLFKHQATLDLFRQILTMHSVTLETMPLGTTPCQKGGSLDHLDKHVLALQGSTYMDGRWVSYSTMLNWVDGQGPTWTELEPRFGRVLKRIFGMVRQGM